MSESQKILHDRLATLHRRVDSLERAEMGEADLQSMAHQLRNDNAQFKQRLSSIKMCRQLLSRQTNALTEIVSVERFEGLIEQTRTELQESWSTRGMNKAIANFFRRFEYDLLKLQDEGLRANETVKAMFARLGRDVYQREFQFPEFSVATQLEDIQELRRRAAQYRRNPKMVFTEQTVIIRNFFQTFVRQVRELHESILSEVNQWAPEVLMPLVQFMKEEKKSLDDQIVDVKQLASRNTTLRDSQNGLQEQITDTHRLIREANTFQQNLMNTPKQIG